ncbi:hypothetical protein [Pollutibacter soli]|uniref:hypothetical protein n=1 Tax=Pollutibacter soli TaxID=3034157 RepID=UPI003013C099
MSIKTKTELKQALEDQHRKVAASQQALITTFQETKENLRPANLLKNTVKSVTGNSGTAGTLLKAGLGIGAALLTKRFVTRGAGTIAGRALGIAMNLGLVNAVATPLKNKGLSILKKLLHRGNGIAKKAKA